MEDQQFKTIIRSKPKFIDLHLKETFQYRDLIFLFTKRDFISKYKQTILGPLWAIIQPLLTTVVFTIIFGNLANLTITDVKEAENLIIPGFLFYMSGTICWSYFSTTVTSTANTFLQNSTIMGKVYYPRLVSPLSAMFSNLISFFIQLMMFVIIWLFYLVKGTTDMMVSRYLLLLPLLILQMMLLSTGVGIIVSALTTKYRDLAMLISFGLQLWQYASPIAYGLLLIPEKYMTLYMLNPVTPIVTTFRYAFFGVGYFNWIHYLTGWLITIVLFLIGLILFNKVERTFMDTI